MTPSTKIPSRHCILVREVTQKKGVFAILHCNFTWLCYFFMPNLKKGGAKWFSPIWTGSVMAAGR